MLMPFIAPSFGPQQLIPGSGDWTGDTANVTIGTGTLSWNAGDGSVYCTTPMTGDFDLSFQGGASNNTFSLGGFFATSEVGTFDPNAQTAGTGSMTNAMETWRNDGVDIRIGWAGVEKASGASESAPTVQLITRRGSEIKVYHAGNLKHTFTETYSNPVYFWIGSGGTLQDYQNIQLDWNL